MDEDDVREHRAPFQSPISIDWAQLEALLHFPNEPDLAESLWKAHQRHLIIKHYQSINEWPAHLSKAEFEILAHGVALDSLSDHMNERRVSGWLTSSAMHYYLKTKVWRDRRPVEERTHKGTLAAQNKFLHHISKNYQGKTVPGTDKPQPIGEERLTKAKKQTWNTAHLWLALFHNANGKPFHEMSGEEIIYILRVAETYRGVAITCGIFELLFPDTSYDESRIFSAPEFPPLDIFPLSGLTISDLDHIGEYISKQSIAKGTRKARRSNTASR